MFGIAGQYRRRQAALQAAVKIGDTKLLPEILKLLNHTSEGVSIEAATAMLQIIERHPNDASEPVDGSGT